VGGTTDQVDNRTRIKAEANFLMAMLAIPSADVTI
jgi:hypothetical protein